MPAPQGTVQPPTVPADAAKAAEVSKSLESLGHAERRLRETAEAITRLLCEDIALYPERELRRRFIDSDDADQLSEADLAELRHAAQQLGKQMAQKLERELAWPGPWPLCVARIAPATQAAASTVPVVADPRPSLRDLPLVWGLVAAVDALVEQTAAQFRLAADDRQPIGYGPPARFIGRAHLPALTDQLFKQLREAEQLRGQVDTESADLRRRRRAERWAPPQD